jgi:hypothetical protein
MSADHIVTKDKKDLMPFCLPTEKTIKNLARDKFKIPFLKSQI